MYAADQLFATLDPTLRKIELPDVGAAILADTVGFIRHLPHDLVAAFKATLQETQEADLLLHVVDYADDQYGDNMGQVNDVLNEIDAGDIPQLIICNKIDRLEGVQPRIDYDDEGRPIRVWLSAQQGIGVDLLHIALTECLAQTMQILTLNIPATDGKIRSVLYEYNCITEQHYDDAGNWVAAIRLPMTVWYQLDKRYEGALSQYAGIAPQQEDDYLTDK